MRAKPILIALLVLAASFTAVAVPPSGSYVVTSDDIGLKVWNPSGSYSDTIYSEEFGGGLDVSYNFTVDTAGKIVGAGSITYSGYVDYSRVQMDVGFNVTGKLYSSGSVKRLQLKFRINGGGEVDYEPVQVSGTLTEDFTLDEIGRQLYGTVKGTVRARNSYGSGSAPVFAYVSTALPAEVDGAWRVDTTVQTAGARVAGSATVTLSNGDAYDFAVRGSYSMKTDKAKLAYRGVGASNRMSLNAEAFSIDEELQLTKFTGSLFGQKIQSTAQPSVASTLADYRVALRLIEVDPAVTR